MPTPRRLPWHCPNAMQVAVRWYLMENASATLLDAVQRFHCPPIRSFLVWLGQPYPTVRDPETCSFIGGACYTIPNFRILA
ncbi:protein of unknown function [Rhodovastum atsumiense]|nr:protein of unknown function [Rhodovastum atsumiense]